MRDDRDAVGAGLDSCKTYKMIEEFAIAHPKKPRGSLELLRDRKFGTYWVGSLLSNMGTWMQQMAEPWLILNLSGSPVLLGIDAFVMDAPTLVLTLFGGWLADNGDRRKIIFFFQALQMLCPIILIVLVLTGLVSVWMIIALSLVVGITDALSMPAFQSVVPGLVEKNEIGHALALNSTQFNLSRIAGPAIAGWIMLNYGAVGCFGANTLSYIPMLACVYLVIPRKKISLPQGTPRPLGFVNQLKDTLKNRKRREAIFAVFATSLFCGPLIAFCPVLIREVFHGDVGQFGTALTVFGIGGLIGAILFTVFDLARYRMRLGSWLAILYGFVIICISFNRSPFFLELLLILSGVLMTTFNTGINSLLQFHAPEHMRGQISSLYMLSLRGGMSIGNLIAGPVVTQIGISRFLLINGCLVIAYHVWRKSAWNDKPTQAMGLTQQ